VAAAFAVATLPRQGIRAVRNRGDILVADRTPFPIPANIVINQREENLFYDAVIEPCHSINVDKTKDIIIIIMILLFITSLHQKTKHQKIIFLFSKKILLKESSMNRMNQNRLIHFIND
jgi:hypothetical protein